MTCEREREEDTALNETTKRLLAVATRYVLVVGLLGTPAGLGLRWGEHMVCRARSAACTAYERRNNN